MLPVPVLQNGLRDRPLSLSHHVFRKHSDINALLKEYSLSFSIYQASVPVYAKLLAAQVGMIEKAVTDAETRKFAPEILFMARLHPNMWSFSEQVKATTNHAFRGTARLAGLPIPEVPGEVGTEVDMKARIAATLAFIQSVDPVAIDAGHDREITFPLGGETVTMTGVQYFLGFTLPNFYFHHTTAYNILRHNGVSLSKPDFLGGV